LARAGGEASKEYEDDSFGDAMAEFKALLSGRGKTPKGSTVLLTRDETGTLGKCKLMASVNCSLLT